MHIADIHTIHSAQWMDINDTGTHSSTQYTAQHTAERERRGQIALRRGCSAMMRAAVPRGWQPCFLNGGKVPSATKLFSKQRQGAVMTPNKLLFWGRSPSTIPACNSETRGNSLLSSFEATLACNLHQCLLPCHKQLSNIDTQIRTEIEIQVQISFPCLLPYDPTCHTAGLI